MNERNHSIYEADVLHACPACGSPVDPDAADTLEGFDLSGGGEGGSDVTTVFFHDDCFPYTSRRYELV